jgi:hypothetical protein
MADRGTYPVRANRAPAGATGATLNWAADKGPDVLAVLREALKRKGREIAHGVAG